MSTTPATIDIIGRDYERSRLNKMFYSEEAEFAAIYGRRRVGKTFLVKNYFAQQDCIFFQASGILKASSRIQLKEFKKAIELTFYKDFKSTKLQTPLSWMDALEMLHEAIERLSNGRKVVLFLDEFPWMALKKTHLLQALDYYWNRYWSAMPQVKLIICGSAASWIIKNILNNKGGLHNRVTLKLLLKPFTLIETQAYLKSRDINYQPTQIVQLYMCIGGIPYYLKFAEKGLSAMQNVSQMCFQETGTLLDEFNNLFSSLFSHHEIHEAIIRLIASKREGIAREIIEEKMQLKGGRLSLRLKELEEAGFIASYLPWEKKRGKYYKLIDEYTLFYLSWIEPMVKENKINSWNENYWNEASQSPAWRAWSGYAFEAVCFKHISWIRQALHIPESAHVYTWRYFPKKNEAHLWQGVQIDLVFDRNDGIITICEIKYSQNQFKLDKTVFEELQRKAAVYQHVTQTTKQIFLSMITSNGIQASTYKDSIQSITTLEDFFVQK